MRDAAATAPRRETTATLMPRCAPDTRRTAILASCSALFAPERAEAAETVKVGQMAPLSGPAAESGQRQVNGAKQAVEVVNTAGGVLGRPVELFSEDDQSTNPGGILAFSRLAPRGDLVGFPASNRSTLLHAIAPDVQRIAEPTVTAGSDPNLTRLGRRWMFRVRPNDRYSARMIVDFGTTAPKKQSWATWTYDGLTVLANGINKAGSTGPEKIRSAVLATQRFKGVEGEYRFGKNGDRLRGCNIVRNEGGRIVFDRRVELTD